MNDISNVDKRSEAIYQLGHILSKFSDTNVIDIRRDVVDRDIARVTFKCPVRQDNYTISVNIGGDSVTEAIKDLIRAVEG